MSLAASRFLNSCSSLRSAATLASKSSFALVSAAVFGVLSLKNAATLASKSSLTLAADFSAAIFSLLEFSSPFFAFFEPSFRIASRSGSKSYSFFAFSLGAFSSFFFSLLFFFGLHFFCDQILECAVHLVILFSLLHVFLFLSQPPLLSLLLTQEPVSDHLFCTFFVLVRLTHGHCTRGTKGIGNVASIGIPDECVRRMQWREEKRRQSLRGVEPAWPKYGI
mmetsp:Transcript_61177/g.101491  ORF Transcript_61177/g.101491 Transcript_61177/m.101491 type:complete len:222 (-) Transcript_61177:126-791(-)